MDIDLMFEFLKQTNDVDEGAQEELDIDLTNDSILNCPITPEEIEQAVHRLKSNKSPGNDQAMNEYICSTLSIFLTFYVDFFNLIFDAGVVPEEWLTGIVKPIYKNKGDPHLPDNYRPITLLSCMGKLFTSILCERLNNFADEIELISESQTGFRKGYSTIDNMFIIYLLSKYALSNKKKLYCAFIDFKQAFDTVWRDGLWGKILKSGIDGKCVRFIQNTCMYKGIKSKVQIGHDVSDYFMCKVGVRQGENLSPFLFSIYINDLEEYL